MNTPPGLLGAAVLFWGWHSGFLLPAAILAALLEASRLVPWRWDFSRADLNRISDLCTIVFLGMAGYLVVTRDVV
ncbi:MAG: transglutaminase-like domain-containing protein, partial [Candidatus Entotheonellia bacterium]